MQTPIVGLPDRWKLWFENRELIKQLMKGDDVLLNTVDVARTKSAIFKKMGDLTAGSGREIALLRTNQGLVFRMGTSVDVKLNGAKRVIAHTHPNGRLGLSGGDYGSIFLNKRGFRQRPHKSTIIVGPSGAWRRYASNQTILGGSF